jgi:hypothetical protein
VYRNAKCNALGNRLDYRYLRIKFIFSLIHTSIADNNSEQKDDLDTKLWSACRNGIVSSNDANVMNMQAAIAAVADVNYSYDGLSCLSIAVFYGHHEIAVHLIAARANIEVKTKSDSTALIIAAQFGQDKCVKLLINAGADLAAVDSCGRTALQCACNAECRDLLLAARDKSTMPNKIAKAEAARRLSETTPDPAAVAKMLKADDKAVAAVKASAAPSKGDSDVSCDDKQASAQKYYSSSDSDKEAVNDDDYYNGGDNLYKEKEKESYWDRHPLCSTVVDTIATIDDARILSSEDVLNDFVRDHPRTFARTMVLNHGTSRCLRIDRHRKTERCRSRLQSFTVCVAARTCEPS